MTRVNTINVKLLYPYARVGEERGGRVGSWWGTGGKETTGET